MEMFCTVILNLWVWGVKFKYSSKISHQSWDPNGSRFPENEQMAEIQIAQQGIQTTTPHLTRSLILERLPLREDNKEDCIIFSPYRTMQQPRDWMAPNWGFAFGGNNIFFCWKRDTVRYHHKFSQSFSYKRSITLLGNRVLSESQEDSKLPPSQQADSLLLPPASASKLHGDAVRPAFTGKGTVHEAGQAGPRPPLSACLPSLSISGTVTVDATSPSCRALQAKQPVAFLSLFQWRKGYLPPE